MPLHHRLRDGLREYVILELQDLIPEDHEPVTVGWGWTLEHRLLQLARDDSNLRTLRSLVYAHGHASSRPLTSLRSAEDVARQAASLFSFGLLRLARAPLPQHTVAPPFAETPEVAPPVEDAEPLWLRLQVVDDVTDAPISGIQLRIQFSDASEQQTTTDSEGRVDLKDVPAGAADVLSVLDGATLDNTLALVRTGGPWSQQKPAKAGAKGKASSTKRVLARIAEHQVRDGETLESVAEMYGLTVEALAKFNWGTADPAEIQRYLLLEVGCVQKDRRGRYVFSSEDVPGILRIPRPVAVSRMAVEQSHILRVKKVPEPRPYLFSL
ncbi:LysM peptidoglycan-binding domain-containing protein [Pyxidicoccus parkwayensis]|uniref:LysM peptidoglycan-binding domain-containing protein n=1 Tax=Pyxidicoccus parkwayensis TaxID=2813578 RepID=A0ABX7NWG4_9BACT|nr:LysM domain-containing protein [Pyxidicoccus parkwaysis]QSQ21739.1 LysM peptidoglycan-binding domain-containing protein [Pyxidicoccus parkwaysis]